MKTIILFALLTICETANLLGQTEVVRLLEGSAVRFQTRDGDRISGLLLESYGPGSRGLRFCRLTTRCDSTNGHSIGLRDLEVLEVESGDHGIRGAAIGAVLGLFVGSLFDMVNRCDNCGTVADIFRPKVLAGWVGGAALGYVAGSGSRRWTVVALSW